MLFLIIFLTSIYPIHPLFIPKHHDKGVSDSKLVTIFLNESKIVNISVASRNQYHRPKIINYSGERTSRWGLNQSDITGNTFVIKQLNPKVNLTDAYQENVAELIALTSYILSGNNASVMVSLSYLLNNFMQNNQKNTNNLEYFLAFVNEIKTSIGKSGEVIVSTPTNTETDEKSDKNGARLYVVVVVGLYASIVLVMLAAKVKPANKLGKEEKDREKAEKLLRTMQEYTVTKSILEQLSNKEYRRKVWSIYRSGRKNSASDLKHNKQEENTLKIIEKKIEDIQKSKKTMDESTAILDNDAQVSDSSDSKEIKKTYKQYNLRRDTFHGNIGLHPSKSKKVLASKTIADMNSTSDREQVSRTLKEWGKNFNPKSFIHKSVKNRRAFCDNGSICSKIQRPSTLNVANTPFTNDKKIFNSLTLDRKKPNDLDLSVNDYVENLEILKRLKSGVTPASADYYFTIGGSSSINKTPENSILTDKKCDIFKQRVKQHEKLDNFVLSRLKKNQRDEDKSPKTNKESYPGKQEKLIYETSVHIASGEPTHEKHVIKTVSFNSKTNTYLNPEYV